MKFFNNICGFESNKVAACFAKIIIGISFIGIIILFFVIPWRISCLSNPEFCAIFIGTMIAIANALLLYATLQSQNYAIQNEKENRRQEQFERTFFNILDSHRKLVDEISAPWGYVNDDAKESIHVINGRRFFSFATNELLHISNALKSKTNNKYNVEDLDKRMEAFDIEWDEKISIGKASPEDKNRKKKEFLNIVRLEYCNLVYDISDDDRQKFPNDERLPYALFKNKWYGCYEHYIRNFYYLLQFVEDHHLSKEAKLQYIKAIQSQMSRVELFFIEQHAQSFPLFQKIINATRLTQYLE